MSIFFVAYKYDIIVFGGEGAGVTTFPRVRDNLQQLLINIYSASFHSSVFLVIFYINDFLAHLFFLPEDN